MTDPSIEERKHWIRKKWIEKLEFDQKIFNVRLSKSLSSEEADRVRQLLDDSSKLKERIEGGFTPKEAPVMSYKHKDGNLIPLTQEEEFENEKIHDEAWDLLELQPDIIDIENDPETIKRLRKEQEERDSQKSKILNLLFVLVLGLLGGIGIRSLLSDRTYGSMYEANEACKEWQFKANSRYESGRLVSSEIKRVCSNEEETKQFLGRDLKTWDVIKRFKY